MSSQVWSFRASCAAALSRLICVFHNVRYDNNQEYLAMNMYVYSVIIDIFRAWCAFVI